LTIFGHSSWCCLSRISAPCRLGNHQSPQMNMTTFFVSNGQPLYFWSLKLVLFVTHQRTVKAGQAPISINEHNHRTLSPRDNPNFLRSLNLAMLICHNPANVSCDGRGGESIGRSRGLSLRPSSTHSLDVKTCVIIDSTVMLNYSRHGRYYAV